MKLFALYLSSRGTTVNNTSRAGRAKAKLPARRITWKTTRAAIVGAQIRVPKPMMLKSGSNDKVSATPMRLIVLPVTNNCAPRVKILTHKSMLAKNAVRAPRSAKYVSAISACWKYKKVEVTANSKRNTLTLTRYGDFTACDKPLNIEPPIGDSSRCCAGRALNADERRDKRPTQKTAISSKSAEATNRNADGTCLASAAVTPEPMRPPTVAPAAMKPNNRLPCSVSNTSTMSAQKTETTNRLKIDVQ